MPLTIAVRHTDITDAMRDYAEKRVGRLLDHFDTLSDVRVTLNVERNRHQAEIVANCRRAGPVVARAEGADMYATLDEVVDKMMNQLRRQKERLKDHRVQKPGAPSAGETPGADAR